MQENNGAAAPNEPTLDAAIDSVIDDDQQPVIEETHKLASKLSEMEQQLRAKDEVITRRDRDYQALVESSRKQSEMLSKLVGDIGEAKDRGYQYERERLMGLQRQAAAEADVNRHDQITHAIAQLDYQKATAEAKPKEQEKKQDAANPAAQTQVDPVVTAWLADNQWMKAPRMFREAAAIEANIQEDKPYLTTTERLNEVRAEMAKRYPDKFQNQARQQPTAVSRPGPQAAARPKPKEPTLADLDEDSKAALANIKRLDPKFKEETYLKHWKARETRQKEISRL